MMAFWLTSLALAITYLGCVAFFEAGERRGRLHEVLTLSPSGTWLRRWAWAALIIALFLFAQPQGWERGVPIWLGALSVAGGISLLISALLPRWHIWTGAGAGLLASIAAAGALITGLVP
ncbi:MAG: DUF3325 family protein [Pseudomonadota bacterium]